MKNNNKLNVVVDNDPSRADFCGTDLPHNEKIENPQAEPRDRLEMLSVLAARSVAVAPTEANPKEEQDTLPTPIISDPKTLDEQFCDVSSPEKLGAALASTRSESKMTKVSVAAAMGTSEGSVRRIEKGSNPQGWDTVLRYLDAIGKKVEIRIVDREP